MSTYQVVLQYRQYVECDATGCDRWRASEVIDKVRQDSSVQGRLFFASVAREGWTLFSGRTLRAYCPHHHPQEGHSMKDVTAEWGTPATASVERVGV